MKRPRRQFLQLAAGAAAFPAVSRIATAQTYPTKPVRIVVGFAAGGGTDILARLIGQRLSERLAQQFIVENRPGGNSNIATEAVARAPPDGYTLLVVDSSPAINATLYDKLSFNFIRDIAPVAGIANLPLVMLVNPSFPAKTIPELIAYAKANPDKISMASGGNGNVTHLVGEMFKMMTGINMVHLPYRGGGGGAGGPARRAGAGLVHRCGYSHRIHQSRQTTGARSDLRDALGGAARRTDRRAVPAGLRGRRLDSARPITHHLRSSTS
jgi:tripartite-type tricarboxylate transporter receptor subunit TctC